MPNIAQIAGSAISFVADILALKILSSVSPDTQALVSRITDGFISKDACAARARTQAASLDRTFPFMETLLGERPSVFIKKLVEGAADSAATQCRRLAQNIESYLAPAGRALQTLLPAAARMAGIQA